MLAYSIRMLREKLLFSPRKLGVRSPPDGRNIQFAEYSMRPPDLRREGTVSDPWKNPNARLDKLKSRVPSQCGSSHDHQAPDACPAFSS